MRQMARTTAQSPRSQTPPGGSPSDATRAVARGSGPASGVAPGTGRLAFLDLLRVACVFYIVGLWHLQQYTRHHIVGGASGAAATVVVLSIFTLASGYLTHRRGWPASGRAYAVHRFVRLYPLFALAVVAYLALGIITARVAVLSLLLVSVLHGPAPLTLWYVVMLIDFEIVYLAVGALRSSPYLWVVVAGLAVGIALLYGVVGGVDHRFLIYAPSFVAGILLARGDRDRALLIGAAVLLPIGLLMSGRGGDAEYSVMSVPFALSSGCLIFFGARACYRGRPRLDATLRWLAYISFCMYLVHRPVYVALRHLYVPASAAGQYLLLLTVGLALVIVLAWVVQSGYDRAVAATGDALTRRRAASGARD